MSDERGARTARELEGHVAWLDTFTGAALGVLATASGIYTYIGVSALLDDTGALKVFAALAYSIAVSVGIFVFWAYLMRILPAVRSLGARLGLALAMVLGSAAIVAMSSWLNAAALAGAAAVERHLEVTLIDYQTALERANQIAVEGQGLERDVARMRQGFTDLAEREAAGGLSGFAGRGAVVRLLGQKSDELAALEAQIAAQGPAVAAAFDEGNAILSRMRGLLADTGPVAQRSVTFSEEAVRLSNVIVRLRQLSPAPLVVRAADDLSQSFVVPVLDGANAETRAGQAATIDAVLVALGQRAETLRNAAQAVVNLPPPAETIYTPISPADAVILYAANFAPSWAGAIAIDLLPVVLVLILAITQAAIRSGREGAAPEDTMSLKDLRAALRVAREIEGRSDTPPEAARAGSEPLHAVQGPRTAAE